ncbi:MAG: DUF4369 domain-containing protein [Bacteroidales bacterium]|nr:DUF4369 domain-containing protein [Bacteroidales bacterium]
MRGIIILTVVFFISISCSNIENGYIIKGVIDGSEEVLNGGKIYILKHSQSKIYLDSAIMKSGKFVFKGNVDTPDKYLLYVNGLSYNIPLFLENSRYIIKAKSDNLREAVVSGGETQSLINISNSKSRDVMKKYNLNAVLNELMGENVSEERREHNRAVLERANIEMKRFTDSLIHKNLCAYFTLLNLSEIVNTLPLKDVEKRFEMVRDCEKFRNSERIREISSIIERRRELEPGKIAPGFSIANNGYLEPLYELVNNKKLIVLFFWASWSTESVEAGKILKEIYEKYASKGVEIIAVSVNDIDSKQEEVIKNERFSWIHTNNSTNTSLMQDYCITTIPHIFLLNNRGEILSNNLKTNEIYRCIEEILKN